MIKAINCVVLISTVSVLAGCSGSELDGTYVGRSHSAGDDAIVLKVKHGEALFITAIRATESVSKKVYKADVDGNVLTLTAKGSESMVLAKRTKSMDLGCQRGPCTRGELPSEWTRMLVAP